jgi:hypothetical protein
LNGLSGSSESAGAIEAVEPGDGCIDGEQSSDSALEKSPAFE